MQRAETVLGIIRERGTRELPLNNIYRQLFNPDLYLRAYAVYGKEKFLAQPFGTVKCEMLFFYKEESYTFVP